jgi:hypothetical protein
MNRADNLERSREYDRQRANLPHRVEARKEYQQTEAHKQSHALANPRYRQKNKEKYAAHTAVANALKSGELSRSPCVICGDTKSEGHHEDYSLPLDVTWLCDTHHKARHRQLNASRRSGVAAITIEQFILEQQHPESA